MAYAGPPFSFAFPTFLTAYRFFFASIQVYNRLTDVGVLCLEAPANRQLDLAAVDLLYTNPRKCLQPANLYARPEYAFANAHAVVCDHLDSGAGLHREIAPVAADIFFKSVIIELRVAVDKMGRQFQHGNARLLWSRVNPNNGDLLRAFLSRFFCHMVLSYLKKILEHSRGRNVRLRGL
jgi:hypothetical protein